MSTKEEKPEDINDLLAKIAVATGATSTASTVAEPSTNVELTNKIADALFNTKNRKMLGFLSGRQISGVKRLLLINDIVFNNKRSVLTRIIENEIDLSVSEHGLGREQLVKLTKVDDPVEPVVGRIKRYLQ